MIFKIFLINLKNKNVFKKYNLENFNTKTFQQVIPFLKEV